jgi:hypothetical protein
MTETKGSVTFIYEVIVLLLMIYLQLPDFTC